MTIKELGEKYGFDQKVHFVILDKDVDGILNMDGITKNQPDYLVKKWQAVRNLQELFQIFIDSLGQITVGLKSGLPLTEIRKQFKNEAI